jgi:hypothetical protein
MALKLAEPFRSAVLWMPDDTKVSFDRMVYWVTVPWDSRQGRVTLVGDAAHPMAPCKSLYSLSFFRMKLNIPFQFVVKDSTTLSKMPMISLKL